VTDISALINSILDKKIEKKTMAQEWNKLGTNIKSAPTHSPNNCLRLESSLRMSTAVSFRASTEHLHSASEISEN